MCHAKEGVDSLTREELHAKMEPMGSIQIAEVSLLLVKAVYVVIARAISKYDIRIVLLKNSGCTGGRVVLCKKEECR